MRLSKINLFLILFFAIAAQSSLSCATSFRLVPPSTEDGRKCSAACGPEKSQCERDQHQARAECHRRVEEDNRQCEKRAAIEQKRCESRKKENESCIKDFCVAAYSTCENGVDCESDFRVCWVNCGGKAIEE